MKLIDLIRDTQFFLVEEALEKLYYSEKDDEGTPEYYAEVYEKILLIEPQESDMTVHVVHIHNETEIEAFSGKIFGEHMEWEAHTDIEDFYDVSGTNGKTFGDEENCHEAFKDEEIGYALEFRPWKEWAGYKVVQEELDEIGAPDYLAHILWEMSFIDFDEAVIKETIDGVIASHDKVKKHLDDGGKLEDISTPLNEIIEKLDDEG